MSSLANTIKIQEKRRAIEKTKKHLRSLNERLDLCGTTCCGADDTELNKLALLVHDAKKNVELIDDAAEWLKANRDYQRSLENITDCWVTAVKEDIATDCITMFYVCYLTGDDDGDAQAFDSKGTIYHESGMAVAMKAVSSVVFSDAMESLGDAGSIYYMCGEDVYLTWEELRLVHCSTHEMKACDCTAPKCTEFENTLTTAFQKKCVNNINIRGCDTFSSAAYSASYRIRFLTPCCRALDEYDIDLGINCGGAALPAVHGEKCPERVLTALCTFMKNLEMFEATVIFAEKKLCLEKCARERELEALEAHYKRRTQQLIDGVLCTLEEYKNEIEMLRL